MKITIVVVILIGLMLFSTIIYISLKSKNSLVPVNCSVSDWSVWSQCSATCGTGTRTKTRTILEQPQYGGQPCPSLTEPENCNTQPCPISPPISVPVDCRVSDWSVPQCSQTCGTGTRTKSRTILQHPQYGGQPCPSLTEPENCNTQPCPISPPISVPVDCRVSDWSVWSQCSATCGTGTRTKSRTILQHPQYGGQPCPSLTEPENCNTQPCPIDCSVSDWSVWTQCSQTCGTGTRTKSRTILQQPQYGGQPCPSLTEPEDCNTQPCPVNCRVSDWSVWSQCSATCGTGTRTKTRTILQYPQYGGEPCPSLTEPENCNTQPCPRNLCNQWNKCLAVPGNKKDNSVGLVQYDKTNEEGQKWQFTPEGNLCNQWNKCLAVPGNKKVNSVGLVQYDKTNEEGQKWQFTPEGNLCNQWNKCLAVPSNKKVNSVGLVQYDKTNEEGQKWQFV